MVSWHAKQETYYGCISTRVHTKPLNVLGFYILAQCYCIFCQLIFVFLNDNYIVFIASSRD